MTIYEVEARFKIGPFQFGEKLGNSVELGEEVVLTERDEVPEVEIIDFIIDLEEKLDCKIPILEDDSDEFGFVAKIESGDSIRLGIYWGSQAVYDSPIEKDEINRHPELKGRLRWVPDVSK